MIVDYRLWNVPKAIGLIGLVASLCLAGLFVQPSIAQANTARSSYFKAYRLFQRKKWSEAKAQFLTTLKLVKKLPSRTSRQKLFVNLGWCDIQYHLARIELATKRPQYACHTLDKLVNRISFVKKKWPRWRRQRINLLLPGRFRDAKRRYKSCTTIPTRVTLTELPPKAKVFVLEASSGQPDKWKETQPSFETTKPKVKVRVEAPGYIKQERELEVGRWLPKTIPFALKKKPKPTKRIVKRTIVKRRVIKRRPVVPPPKPITSEWWFWAATIGGTAVVAGAVVGTVIYINSQPPILQPSFGQKDIFPTQ